jgi:CubicO group peptidase (beta-lactamase class C family)
MLLRCLSAILLFLSVAAFEAKAAESVDRKLIAETVAKFGQMPQIHGLIVAQNGTPIIERVFRGPALDRPVNIKSASKTIIDALVGIAIERGMIKSVDQPILPLIKNRAPQYLDPKVQLITVDHLLSMRAGLERTSGTQRYGRWVSSPNWVSYALTRPFDDEPGGNMLYSTADTHLLSAILTDVSGLSTYDLLRDWLAKPLDVTIPPWSKDPQGVYLGGNEMAVSPRALLRFGEMYRNGGLYEGKRVVPESWIRASWTEHTLDRGGAGYGYGWFIIEAHGHPVYYAWGYGGQFLYVVPSLKLTVVVTSDSDPATAARGYLCPVHDLIAFGFMPALMADPPDVRPDDSVCVPDSAPRP